MGDHDDGEHRSRRTSNSPILWQSPDKTVTLLDIPHSISKAQGHHPSHTLLSSPPLSAPFPSNEPKSASARAKLVHNTIDAELNADYARLLDRALPDVRRNHDGLWCLPRLFTEDAPRPTKKRRLEDDREHISAQQCSDLQRTMLVDPCIIEDEAKFFFNDTAQIVHLQRPSTKNEESSTFHIPPGASFYLGDCADSHSFHTVIRNQAQQNDSRREFDFILLDPPWPNRSVKRTHKTPDSTYSTSPSLWDIRGLILDMDLDRILADDCLVGIWITNKPAVRELVLDEDGIFACWGVKLVEEWIWLKTTVSGEPVTPLDALWRKPYEVLLLGRKRSKARTGAQHSEELSSEANAGVKRRVMIAVPDLHSRKPCLKELIEPLIPGGKHYRALEVFARHLVTGWWSWGDECIRFNCEGCWRNDFEEDEFYVTTSGDVPK